MGIETYLPYLSPEAQALAAQALQAGDQQMLDMMVQIIESTGDINAGIQALEQAVQQFLAESGMAPAPTAGPQDMPAPVGPQDAMPVGGPMPMDPMMAGMPVDPMTGMPMDPGMMGMPPGAPSGPPPPEPTPQRPQVKEPTKPPNYKLPPVPKVKKPTYSQIIEDARAGREYWAARDLRIRQDIDLYHLTYDADLFPGIDASVNNGVVIHKRSQPNTFVNLVTSLCTAKNDKLQVIMDPRSEIEEWKTATQNAEDAIRCWREDDEDRWLEDRINEPPLPRKEAGLAALEGGFGWTWTIDPDNDDCPFQYEIVPLSQLYDVGHATTRQFSLPLHQARARYEAIEKAYPIEGRKVSWDPNQKVRLIIHGDNRGVWRSIVWEEIGGGKPGTGRDATNVDGGLGSRNADTGTPEKWVQQPEKVNFGFPYFSYMTWGGSPVEALPDQLDRSIQSYKGAGVLTMLRKTFRLMDLFISAIATGAIRAVDPPYMQETDSPNPPQLDFRPHAQNFRMKGDKTEPLVWAVSQNADSQNLMNSLIAELQDVSSPALMGQPGVSGVAQQMSTDQASQQVVGPIIDALEKWYSLQHKQRLMLALRYSKDDKYNRTEDDKENTLFDKYPKRGTSEGNRGQHGYLKPGDVEKSGVRVKVRYTDRNIQEEMALANMVQGLVGAHLMSQETALRRMGVQDPQKEMQRIFADGAFMEPAVLKALVETAVYNSGNPILIDAWDKAFYAEVLAGQQGSQPAPAGTPSVPNQPGVNTTGASSAVQAPGAQQAAMMPASGAPIY